MQEYRLKSADLETLQAFERDNPHYKKAAPMQLYLHAHVRECARRKWGSDEPYLVTLVDLSESLRRRLVEDEAALRTLSPGDFQNLVGNRLSMLGLEVQLIGDVYRKDGGVDLIAYPKLERLVVPFLLAVQTKHHRTNRKTGPADVRDFQGAIASRGAPFHLGMIVTNTTFTPDARWFAEQNQLLLRLRDIADLQRWLRNDFVNEAEWREIPKRIDLAPGVSIEIPRPPSVTPSNSALQLTWPSRTLGPRS